jgi:hypothetical protein
MTQVFGEPMYPPSLLANGAFPKEELGAMMEEAACWMEDTIARFHANGAEDGR